MMINGFVEERPQDAYNDGYEGYEYPGFGLDFEDVMKDFEAGAKEMDPDMLIFMEGFTLQDSMGAFEIGEPRLDTGYSPKEIEFNPLKQLSPDEICWILDTALGYEMDWHSGKFLPHTVFTLQYIHALRHLELAHEIMSVVVGSCVEAQLKCVDLAWAEMHSTAGVAHGEGVMDAEDWQSDKCEVDTLEGLPVGFILGRLDQAIYYASRNGYAQLIPRLQLRRVLLELFNSNPCQDLQRRRSLVETALYLVRFLRTTPQGTPVANAFDPYISRKLNTCVPVRVIPIPEYDTVWAAVTRFLEGLQELNTLISLGCLSTWDTVGRLRLWGGVAPREAYVRSLAQTAMYSGVLVLDKHTFGWALDRFFEDRMGKTLGNSALERRLQQLVISYHKLSFLNPSRYRRRLMKMVVDWHLLWDAYQDSPQVQSTILAVRMESIREIILSGFQLELYAPYERPFAYWYLCVVGGILGQCYTELLTDAPLGSSCYKDLQWKEKFNNALQLISKSCLLITLRYLPPSPASKLDPNIRLTCDATDPHTLDALLRPNFYKRHKWAFRPDYARTRSEPIGHPDLDEFLDFCGMVNQQQDTLDPRRFAEKAVRILDEMVVGGEVRPWIVASGHAGWRQDMLKFLETMRSTASNLANELPARLKDTGDFDLKRLRWDAAVQPWFPTVAVEENEELRLDLD